MNNGDKPVLTTEGQTGWNIERIEREQANYLEIKHPLDNIPNPYEKKAPGKLVILTGVMGAGKTSIAKWLRDHTSLVQYDVNAFFCGANPYFTGPNKKYYYSLENR